MTLLLLNCLAATLAVLLILSFWITPHPACNEEVLAPAPGQGLFVPLGALQTRNIHVDSISDNQYPLFCRLSRCRRSTSGSTLN